jgi:hypothetical protein
MNALPKLDAPKIHICSTLFRPNAVSPIHTVLIGDRYYKRINYHLLAALREGTTPEELDLEPSENGDDGDE